MSELISKQDHRNFRWHLLTTVSALSLTVSISVNATETDQPTVWIDLGGQLERVDGGQQPYAPPFTQISPTPSPFTSVSPLQAQHAARNSYGAEGKIVFNPAHSDWVFSASLRYGRSNNKKSVHQQTLLPSITIPVSPDYTFRTPILAQKFAHTDVRNNESHAILDFQAGKDIGLGLFGDHGSSVASVGVRFAQFTSRSDVAIYARPEFRFNNDGRLGSFVIPLKYFTDFNGQAQNARSFQGIGPSLAWTASTRIEGNTDAGEIVFDWGLNGALLFGRQKASGHHNTIAYSYAPRYFNPHPPTNRPPTNGLGYATAYRISVNHNRSRSVTVPNIGAFAGVSFRRGNAKVSFGYRGDFFFGAADDGVDTRHTVDRNFYGPFATISIGLAN